MKNVKNFYLVAATIICFAAIAVSCKPEPTPEPPKPNELVLSDTAITLTKSLSGKLLILSGNGGYSATSSDTAIATVSVTDTIIAINAIAVGNANVYVIDSKAQTDTFVVIVEAIPAAGMFSFLNQDGVPLPNGGSYGMYNKDDKMSSYIRVQKNGKGEAKDVTLKITVNSRSTTSIGFCGWGSTTCKEIAPGSNDSRTITVYDNNPIDPDIKSMTEIKSPIQIEAKYELFFKGQIQKTTTWMVYL